MNVSTGPAKCAGLAVTPVRSPSAASSSSVREGAYPLIPGVPSDPPSGDYVPAAALAKSSTFLVGSYVTTMTGPSGYDRPGPNETDDAAPGIVALRSP